MTLNREHGSEIYDLLQDSTLYYLQILGLIDHISFSLVSRSYEQTVCNEMENAECLKELLILSQLQKSV